MPNKTIHFTRFTNGLYLASDLSEIPPGCVIRNRGISPLADGKYQNRNGSDQLHDINAAHSLVYFDGVWYSGATTKFYAGSEEIKSSLSGDRLSLLSIQPTAGYRDRLFVAGGDVLFKIDPFTSYVNGAYQWTASGSGTNEYYLEEQGGGDPSVPSKPDGILENGVPIPEGTVGSLTAGQWDWGDNDSLGYNTIYVRLTNSQDPDNQSDGYIESILVQDWGISPPDSTLAAAVGGAGDLTGTYIYKVTFKNSVTGTRSNAAGFNISETSLQLACNGSDASTTFTDDGDYVHTVTAVSDAQLDTAQKKFGTASGLFDGTADKLTIPTHPSFDFGVSNFTIHMWMRVNTVSFKDGTLFNLDNDANNYAGFVFSVTSGTATFRAILETNGIQRFNETGTDTLASNTWYHVALIRGWNGEWDKFAMTVDGTAIATWTYSGSFCSGGDVAIAIGTTAVLSTYNFDGWLDDIQVLKGTALWTENFTKPTSAASNGSATASPTSDEVDLSGIPQPSDDQVDIIELWRTAAGESTYYHLIDLAVGTTTYTDNIPDSSLGSDELPTDNLKPYGWFDDGFGPYNASVFWLSRDQEGERGRVYYSPIGRSEAVDGFIEVCEDNQGLQKGVIFNDTPFVFGISGIYQIYGTNPYFSRRIAGAPGTDKPETVISTPIGIIYEAEDGIHVFNGSSAVPLTGHDVQVLFRGQAAGALTAFSGVVAGYARGEYFISDETQLLALNIYRKTWRDVGDFNIKSIHYAKEVDIIGMGTNTDGIYDFEKEGTDNDNSNTMELDLETAHVRLGDDKQGVVKIVHVDHEDDDAPGETLTVYLEHDGSETSLGTVLQATRDVASFPANQSCREFGVRITGDLSSTLQIHRISAEIYTPGEEIT